MWTPEGNKRGAATRARRQAETDTVMVLRLIDGANLKSTRAERVEAARILTGRGVSHRKIAVLLHVRAMTVSRYRAELALRGPL